MINPYHIQPGLILDMDITSIKRKKATLNGMANVLNEFLHGVSKGFQDAAFAAFSRRRSTVRADISQSFGSAVDAKPAYDESAVPASAYLDMINTGKRAPAIAAPKGRTPRAAAKKTTARAGLPKRGAAGKRGRPPKK